MDEQREQEHEDQAPRPAAEAAGELTDEDLEQAAGGASCASGKHTKDADLT